MNSSITSAITALRCKSGLTLPKFAKLLGMRPTELARIEAGIQRPNLHQANSICEALGCGVHEAFPSSRSMKRLGSKKWRDVLVRELANRETLSTKLEAIGIDLDCSVWTIFVRLRNGNERYFPVTGSTWMRLREQLRERPVSFAVFDSEDLRVALNLAHVSILHALSDPPGTTLGDDGDAPVPGEAEEENVPLLSVQVELDHQSEPLEFPIDEDVLDDPVEEGGMGQMAHILYMLESAEGDASEGRLHFRDCDGDEIFLWPPATSMITCTLWALEPDIRTME
jgi:transcriptional regulator with XRE-family HTH domain